MHVLGIWHVLYLLASSCAVEIEYEGNYADNYGNEISQDQQEEASPTPCQAADFSRWDRLFIALEDSHMRQNMLLESLEQCCRGMVHHKTQVEELIKGSCQQCVPRIESACGTQLEQMSVRLRQKLEDLREEEVEKEVRLNATLHLLLSSIHEGNTRLKRLEEDGAMPSGAAGRQPTPRPGGLGAAFSLAMKPFPSGLKEQEVTTPVYMTTIERALVAMTTELEKVHLQLNRVIAQVEMLRRGRGDT